MEVFFSELMKDKKLKFNKNVLEKIKKPLSSAIQQVLLIKYLRRLSSSIKNNNKGIN
jgi:hypothetical protein